MDLAERISGRKGKLIYALLRKRGTLSKLQLLEESGFTHSTLTRTLDELTGCGLIREVGYGESTGGRRPILYDTNPEYGVVLGLDISRTSSKLVLCDMHMNKLASRRWTMSRDMTPEKLIAELIPTVREWMRKKQLSKGRVLGLGVGAVGPLDREKGMILNPNYFPAPEWRHVPICRDLEEALGFPVLLDNGVNTAVLGEYWSDEAHIHHLLYLHAGVGLRSAVLSNGRLVYGAVDMEGAVGQMVIQTDGRAHRETGGNYGALESYVTTFALEKEAASRVKQGRSSVINTWISDPADIHFDMLIRALAENDAMVTELFRQAAVYLGIGVANLLNILHPEKVILGGPVVTSHPMFFETAVQTAKDKTYYYPTYKVEFGTGRLGEDATAIGAAVMLINAMIQ